VFMSGYTDDEILRRDVSEAGTWYLQKPFSHDALARKVRQALDAPAVAARARA
jgi:two-component system, cell cycle sensor histidine kinase and response regulator CckA